MTVFFAAGFAAVFLAAGLAAVAGLAAAGLPKAAVQVVETTDRAAVGELITMKEFVDVIVPRGGKGLIERISNDARIPVIKHLDGICHTYIDVDADEVVSNSSTPAAVRF